MGANHVGCGGGHRTRGRFSEQLNLLVATIQFLWDTILTPLLEELHIKFKPIATSLTRCDLSYCRRFKCTIFKLPRDNFMCVDMNHITEVQKLCVLE